MNERWRRQRAWRGGLAAALLLIPCGVLAAAPLGEEKVKATMLLQVLQFVDLPRVPSSGEVRLCVLGGGRLQEAVGEALGQQGGRGMRISVTTIDHAADAGACDVVFVAAAADREIQGLVTGHGVTALTVAGREGFARRGGVVNFVYEGGRIGIEINLAVGERRGIRFSSKLLRLARIVESEVVN